MALSKCRDCGREVSGSARACTGCGCRSPVLPIHPDLLGVLVLVGAVLLVGLCLKLT